jgi:hypothetical protein
MLTPEVCTMSKVRRSFTREFKVEAVNLVTESRNPVAQVAPRAGSAPQSATAHWPAIRPIPFPARDGGSPMRRNWRD